MERDTQHPNDELQPMLQSIKGMARAQAPDGLFERVMEQVHRPVARLVPVSRISLVAACLVALIGLNIAVLAIRQHTGTNNTTSVIEIYGTSGEYGYTY